MEPLAHERIREIQRKARERRVGERCQCWVPERRDCHCHAHLCGGCGKPIPKEPK